MIISTEAIKDSETKVAFRYVLSNSIKGAIYIPKTVLEKCKKVPKKIKVKIKL